MNFFQKWRCKHPNAKETKRYFKVTADYIQWYVRAYKVFTCPDCGEVTVKCVYDKYFYIKHEAVEACVYLIGFDYENHETLMLR
jgi:transcription elongation factor Elf1